MTSSSTPPPGAEILSGIASQKLRTFCTNETYTEADLDSYAFLLQRGPLEAIRKDFSQRVQTGGTDGSSGLEKVRQELANITYGPTKVPLFNYLLQLTILNPPSRDLYLEITRFLALEARVPVDSVDLSGTSTFSYAISTKPYWDKEFAEIMLEAGAEVNRRNRYGCTAGHEIVMARDFSPEGKKKTLDALKWFLQKGGNLDVEDGDGVTPRRIGTAVVRLVPEMAELVNGIRQENNGPVRTAKPAGSKLGRNEPCHCGSKRKYKVCCGKN